MKPATFCFIFTLTSCALELRNKGERLKSTTTKSLPPPRVSGGFRAAVKSAKVQDRRAQISSKDVANIIARELSRHQDTTKRLGDGCCAGMNEHVKIQASNK